LVFYMLHHPIRMTTVSTVQRFTGDCN